VVTVSSDEPVQIVINIEDRPGIVEETFGACDQCCTCGCCLIGVVVLLSLLTSLALVLTGCGVG
jgi:hypothetical protein